MKKLKLKPIYKKFIGVMAIIGITAGVTTSIVKEIYPVDNTTTVIEMGDGTKYSIKDLYNQITTTSTSQDVLRQFIITKAIFNQYADKVSDEDVNKQFELEKSEYGENFETVLSQNGLTEDAYKENIKKQLVINYGLRDNVDVTDNDINAAWESYHPESTMKIATFESKDDADQFAKYAQTGDFDALLTSANAVATTADESKFDSANSPLPTNVTSIVWTLENNQVSDAIKGTDTSTDTTYYYVVKMLDKGEKGDDMSKYKDQMTELAETNKLTDETAMKSAITAIMKKSDISIKDPELKDLVAEYLE